MTAARAKSYRAILADLDGTVYRGNRLIPGALEAYQVLSGKGLRWMFLSNSAGRLATDLAAKLNRLGLSVSVEQVVNSAAALIHTLAREYPSTRVMVIGETNLIRGIEHAGVSVTDDPQGTDIVVTALDTGFTYEKLKRAFAAIQRGAKFWATNLDPTFPTSEGFLPGAGTMAAAVGTAAGKSPERVFGKPSADMALLALERLHLDASACLMVGDRIDTDLLFAKNAGMDAALVLTGATSRSQAEKYPVAPDYVLESIADLPGCFD